LTVSGKLLLSATLKRINRDINFAGILVDRKM